MKFLRRNKNWLFALVIIIVAAILLSSSPKNDRLLGMSITEGAIGFDKAFALAKSVGVKAIELPVEWDEYELAIGQYKDKWLGVASDFYPKNGIKISLSLNPIDTNNLRLPADIKDKALNDPEVINRFKSFVDFVSGKLSNSSIFYISIGNEVDIYLGKDEKKWKEYGDFFEAVAPYVRMKFPEAVVGTKMTFESIVNSNNTTRNIISNSDGVLVTYYPFKQGGFIVREPDTVFADFKRVTELYPNKKIYFAEIGYPSGTINGSSEEKQAEFIKNSFSAWDVYAAQIPFLNFVWLHDASPQSVAGYEKYYGSNNKAFSSYLGTLGLRTYDGKDKQAFIQFKKETSERGL